MAVTFDGWTNRRAESFLAVTGHYVKEGDQALTSRLVKLIHTSDKAQTGKNIADILENEVLSGGLKEKVVCTVTDHGKNMKAATDIMGLRHLGCFAHMLNIVVSHAIASTSQDNYIPISKTARVLSQFNWLSEQHVEEIERYFSFIKKYFLRCLNSFLQKNFM